MGLEQALTHGLLGMVGGGAKVIQEQEKFDRENAAKQSAEQDRSEREMAIEERRAALSSTNQKDLAGIQHKNRLAEIKAQGDAQSKASKDPTGDEMKKMQLDDEKKVRSEIAQHEGNIKQWMRSISESPENKQILLPSIEKAQARISELRSGGTTTSQRIEQEEGMDPKQIREVKGKTVPGKLGFSVAESAPRQDQTPQGLPPGTKQIGTSGGKPVYQTPDGRKLIGE